MKLLYNRLKEVYNSKGPIFLKQLISWATWTLWETRYCWQLCTRLAANTRGLGKIIEEYDARREGTYGETSGAIFVHKSTVQKENKNKRNNNIFQIRNLVL